MEKITKHFTHDYENDTTIEWVNTGMYSMLNCSFTSEDPNYGTDTIHYGVGSSSVKPIAQMAYEMLDELTPYLNKRGRGENNSIPVALRKMDDDYSNSTLYAIENALKVIASDYHFDKWFGHLENVTREIAKRMIENGDRSFSFCQSSEDDWSRYSAEEYENIGTGWYGIKRLDSVFDNEPCEYIVAVGYYGGGSFECLYMYDEGGDVDDTINELGRAICKAIMHIEAVNENSVIYATKEKEGN